MARNYAQIMTAIWRNAEFRALGEAEQRGYLLLVTQPDISAAGVLPLRLRRWADMAADSTPQVLTQILKVLEAGRFIVVDWDAEEVLVRSFIRWDGGFNNPKRRPVIIRAATESDSDVIRHHLAVEFQRCGIAELPGGPPDCPPPAIAPPTGSPPDSLSGSPPKIDKAERAVDPFPQVNRLSDTDAASDGVVVTYLSREEPQPATHNPQPVPPSAGANAPATAQTLVGEWIDTCRRRPPKTVIGQTSKMIRGMLEEGIAVDDIRDGIQVWADKGLHPAALPSAVNEIMNAAAARPGRSNNQLRLVRDQFADLTYADLYDQADAITAAKLIRGVWSDPARKPSDPDPTPHRVWVLGPRREFIAANRDKICAALDARRAAG